MCSFQCVWSVFSSFIEKPGVCKTTFAMTRLSCSQVSPFDCRSAAQQVIASLLACSFALPQLVATKEKIFSRIKKKKKKKFQYLALLHVTYNLYTSLSICLSVLSFLSQSFLLFFLIIFPWVPSQHSRIFFLFDSFPFTFLFLFLSHRPFLST